MAETRFIHCELRPEPCRSRFATIVEKSTSGVIVMDDVGTVRFANPAAEKLLGRSAHELLGAPGDFLCAGEIIIDRKDSPAVAAEVRMVEAEWGDKTATLAFLRDITDCRSTEAVLRAAVARLEEEKSQFEAIIGAVGDGITIQNAEYRIIYQNRAYREIMGDHVGARCFRAYAGRDTVCEDCPLKATLEDGRVQTVERCHPKGDRTVYLEITVSPLRDRHGNVTAGIEVVRNVTERKETEENLRYMSTHDILTGLYNRVYFEQELNKLERGRHFPMSIVMVDVDDLKEVNDRLGHAVGDRLLWQTALLLREAFRSEDVVARIGGDEFAVLLPDTGETAVREVVARVRESLHGWNASHDMPIHLSIGFATADSGSLLPEAQKAADQRMYEDKLLRTGRPPRRLP